MKLSIADDGRSDGGAAQLQDNEALHYQVQTWRGSRYRTIRQFPLRCPPVAESKVPFLRAVPEFYFPVGRQSRIHRPLGPVTWHLRLGPDLITREIFLTRR